MGELRLSAVPRLVVGAVCISLLFGVTIRTLAAYGPGWVAAIQSEVIPERRALRVALEAPDMVDLRAIYAARDYKPIWIQGRQVRREAYDFFDRLALSGREDLDPQAYGVGRLAQLIGQTPSGSLAVRAQAELGLSHAFASYVADLHTPLAGAQLVFTDAALSPPWRPNHAAVIARLASEPTLSAAIAGATRMNPIYEQFKQALGDPRLRADAATRRLLLANLERARALPVNLGPRFVLVDVAGAQLWLYDDGRVSDSMKVIVGKPSEPTPMMAGVIRYAVFNPYWNVPPDLVRDTYAPRIRANMSALAALRMDPWSDYTDKARKLDPASVDWTSVAKGETIVGLRQRPGPQNSMGAVKFMLPNELGIYLHDTPNKALFASSQRTFSAGCVRVEDYRRLAQWLYQKSGVEPKGGALEQSVNLPAPVPVYITYFTALPERGAVLTRSDVYGRDPGLLSQLKARSAASLATVTIPDNTQAPFSGAVRQADKTST